MKRLIFILILIFNLILYSCYGYQDINKVSFVSMAIIDTNDKDEIVLYSEMFVAHSGDSEVGGMSRRLMLSDEGETINEAYFNMQDKLSFPMAYNVNKTVVFTENLARKGIKKTLDTIERNQKPTLNVFMFILDGDPEELLNVQLSDEQYIGVYLEETMVFKDDQPTILSVRMNEFLNEKTIGNCVNLLPIISVNEDITQRVKVNGAAVLVDFKMVDKLEPDDVKIYKILTEGLKTGVITIDNPEDEGNPVSLSIVSNNTKKNISYDGEDIVLNVDIDIVLSVMGIEGEGDILDEEKEIQDEAEAEIKSLCQDFYMKFKEKNLDVLKIETLFRRKYPNAQISNVFQQTKLNLNVNTVIEGSQNFTNSQYDR